MKKRNKPSRNPPKVLVVHFGLHKTGSTALQRTLSSIQSNGFRYLSLGQPNHSVPLFTFFSGAPHQYWVHRNNSETSASLLELRRSIGDRLLDQVMLDQQIHVISGEDLALLGREELKDLRSFMSPHYTEIVPVAYFRNPCRWAFSMALQWVRGGATDVVIPPTKFRKTADDWRSVFGSSVKLLSYERERQQFGGVPPSFGAHFLGEKLENPSHNTQIAQPALGVILMLNRANLWAKSSETSGGAEAGRHRLINSLAGLKQPTDMPEYELPCSQYMKRLPPAEQEFASNLGGVSVHAFSSRFQYESTIGRSKMGATATTMLVAQGINALPMYKEQLAGREDRVSLSLLRLLRNL